MVTNIIIDGHDKSGKSTIARALSTALAIPVFKRTNVKFSYDFAIDLLYSVEGYCQFLEQTHYKVIFDRLYPSEYAYGITYKRNIMLEKILELDKRFAKLETVIIICEKSKKEYETDELIEIEKYDELKFLFNQFLNMTSCKSLHLNTDNQNIKLQLKTILSWLM